MDKWQQMDKWQVFEIIKKVAKDGNTVLDLSHRELTEIPTEIGQLKKLKTLYLDRNQLTEIPAEIWQLENLTCLSLSKNQLTEIPTEIGQLKNLKILYLYGNQLTKIPAEIGQLKKLKALYLYENQLTEIPVEIWELKNLTELDLYKNKLTEIPAEIGQLKNLRRLGLYENKLTEIPAEIGELKKLKTLHLYENKLTEIPAELGELKNLTKLDLAYNQLTAMPAKIGQYKNLTSLQLYANKLTAIPTEIGQLKNLKTLRLSNNPLTKMPAEIGELKNLKTLYLSNNQLTLLPAEIGQLKKLKTLYLDNNQLTAIPTEIGQLKDLTTLYLDSNKLTEIPAEIGELKKLKTLHLADNQLITIPAEIGQLEILTELDLADNILTAIPPNIERLKDLTTLYLYGNQLISLPGEIGQLKKLTTLYLYGNQLTFLPGEIGQLKNLKTLYLDRNQLTSPPPEIVEQGTNAILAYLRELAKESFKRYEGKLLILGDGSEGKTCVSRALRVKKFKTNVRTEGVVVEPWSFAHPEFPNDEEKKVTLNIWDFEGQEISHQSHRFFLREESLYLLVFNGRKQFEIDRAEYWLDTIKARGAKSRVILIASECENTTPSWPLEKLKADYGDLLEGERWFFAVGCKDGKGIDELSREIQRAASKMKYMGVEWPGSYARAEDQILMYSKSRAHIVRSEMYRIFKKSGISAENYEGALGQMATLGIVTQFADCPQLEDLIILNPQWLTKAISQVMENEQLETDHGQISYKRMRDIWNEDYKGLYPLFHDCMKEFELCYDMEDEKGALVPLRFGDKAPEIECSDIPGSKERVVEYKLNIRPPYGLMSWFIVKTHYMIVKTRGMPKGVYWHNGVFLATGEGAGRSEALCEFNKNDRILRIRVRAAFPQNLLEQLHGVVGAVFGFFKGLEPERSYGCVKVENNIEKSCEGAHPEKKIIFAISRNTSVACETGWHEVDPKMLVYGFSTFGEKAAMQDDLKKLLDKKPKWAESLVADVMSGLSLIEKTYAKAIKIREKQDTLPAEVAQKVELSMRDYLRLFDEMLDNRDFNSAPAIVSIGIVGEGKFNPTNWFNQEYRLVPYCECKGNIHRCTDASVRFKVPREWWEKTAPKIAVGVKVLSVGLRIAFASLPDGVDKELFDTMKNEVDFMKELVTYLMLKGGAVSNLLEHEGELVRNSSGDTIDLQQESGMDRNRIARMQLAHLLKELAPDNYEARQWGALSRKRMPDNTFRWLCREHAKEYGT